MVASFHHLNSSQALSVLADAQHNNQPIVIFEGFGRNLVSFILLLPSILMPFLLIPVVKPRRLSNFVFTYLIPLIPMIVFFDGWVSFLRIYSVDELAYMVECLPEVDSYKWEIGELGKQKAPYIIGTPLTLSNEVQATNEIKDTEDHQ